MESVEMSKRKRATPSSPTLPVSSSDWAESSFNDSPVVFTSSKESTISLGQLSPKDRRNFLVLCLLYLLQGIPVGLAFGSIPFLLKSKLSYGQVGIFTLASYPYSLKLLWSPVVDAFYSDTFGRRKSWIVPIQSVSAVVLLILGATIQPYLDDAENQLTKITAFFFILVFLCATQDIAVDGWGLTILSHAALPYASTAQTIGLNTGYFMSFTVFLALNSPEFANKYVWSTPHTEGLVTLSGYLTFWGLAYGATTLCVGVFKTEERTKSEGDTGVIAVYKSMVKVLRLRNVQILIAVHLIAKLGFQANEAVTNLKLLEKGLSKEDLSLTVLIDFPFEIIFGYYAAKWSTGEDPLRPWMLAYVGRLVFAVLSMGTVYFFPSSGAGRGYLLIIILVHVLGSFMSTIQFVSINAFHTQISDPVIGGTYMTILNTIANLGGQWPRLLVLNGVDWFTNAICEGSTKAAFSCASDKDKSICKDLGGSCSVHRDGYYVMNVVCITLGVLFFVWIRAKMTRLQRLPTSAWRID